MEEGQGLAALVLNAFELVVHFGAGGYKHFLGDHALEGLLVAVCGEPGQVLERVLHEDPRELHELLQLGELLGLFVGFVHVEPADAYVAEVLLDYLFYAERPLGVQHLPDVGLRAVLLLLEFVHSVGFVEISVE